METDDRPKAPATPVAEGITVHFGRGALEWLFSCAWTLARGLPWLSLGFGGGSATTIQVYTPESPECVPAKQQEIP